MRNIVLDENVYVFALQSEGSPTQENRCAALFVDCLQRSHRWVLTPDIVAAYRRHFADTHLFHRGSIARALMRHLDQVMFDQSRSLWVANPRRIPPVGYHDDDVHIVSAAAAVPGSFLVTLDAKLYRALRESGLAAKHKFEVFDFPEALNLLC